MKFNVADFLRAATQAAHGTIAGNIQGDQDRIAEQQRQQEQQMRVFQMGNELENQQDTREHAYDQGIASVIPHLNPDDQAAWTQTLLQRQAERSQRPRQFGLDQYPGAIGLPQHAPAPGTNSSPQPQPPSPAPQGAPGGLQMPAAMQGIGLAGAPPTPPPAVGGAPPPAPASGGGGGAPPAPPGAGPAMAAAPPQGGAPAMPAGPSPAQLAIMHQALGVMAPFVPGGQQMVDTLHAYHPPQQVPAGFVGPLQPWVTRAPAAAPPQAGAPQAAAPAAAPPAATPATAPAASPAAGPATGAPQASGGGPEIHVPGFPTGHMGGVDAKTGAKALSDWTTAYKDTKDLQDADPATRQMIENIAQSVPGQIRSENDLQAVRSATASIRNLLIGSGKSVEDTRRNNEKALESQAYAVPRDNSAAIDYLEKLGKDFDHHQQVYRDRSTLPDMLGSSRADIQAMERAKAAGDEDTAEEIAATIRGRLQKGMSPNEEGKRVSFVYKDIANLSPEQANDPKVIRSLYEKNGVGYMVDSVPDEALRAGGWRASRTVQTLLGQINRPSFAKLTPESQRATLDALSEAGKESGEKLTLPASIALNPDPVIQKRLSLMDQQITLAGTRNDVALAHLKLDQQRFQLDQQRLALAEKKFAQVGTKAGAKGSTWNREALEHRDMWMQAEKEKATFLRSLKATPADKSTWSPAEQRTYDELNNRAANRKQEYIGFFQQHGVGVGNGAAATKPASIGPLTAAQAQGMSTGALLQRLTAKYGGK